MDIQIYYGAGGKILLEIMASGFNMHDDDFRVILKQGGNEKTVPKSDFIEETVNQDGNESYNYYLIFDSTAWNPGIVNAIVQADVPDFDFPQRIRREVDKFRIIIVE